MTDPRLVLTLRDGVARLVLRRPEKRNALDATMVDALLPLCREIERSAARVLIVTGEGGKSFCAGGDIAGWSALSPEAFGQHWVRDGHAAFDALARLTVPVIAVLNGQTLGGGLELAACADVRIAESQIRIGLPETGLGMVPGWSGTQRLVRRFGAQIVRRMVLGGEMLSAEEGRANGLVDHVVETGSALAEARAYAARVATRGPAAVEISKLMIAVANGEDNGAGVEALGSILAAKTGDLKEGVAAFSEKRQATFKGEW